MIKFDNVTRKYSKTSVALNSVTFDIAKGEFVFIVGPSGAGKTTIMRMIIREDKPSLGKIFVDNQDIAKLPLRKLPVLRRKVGMVFQDFKLLPKKTVFENVAFAMEVAGKTSGEIKKVVPYMLKLVGLKDKVDSFPHQLSGGENQRTAIARAWFMNQKFCLQTNQQGI